MYFHDRAPLSCLLQDKYLLAMADTLDTDTKPRFLILPSPPPSMCLMIKSIAVQELMMPSDVLTTEEEPSETALKAVEHCLDMVHIYMYMCKLNSCTAILSNCCYKCVHVHTMYTSDLTSTSTFKVTPSRLIAVADKAVL